MSSPMFYHLTDTDLASIIAYLRSHSPSYGPPSEVRMRLLARVGIVREGVALGQRELDLMGEVARGRFTHFSDDEIESLHGYLTGLNQARE